MAIPATENANGNIGQGRADFFDAPYLELFGGALPTLEQAFAAPKDTSGYIAFDGENVGATAIHVPFSYQTSLGFQQQVGNDMSFQIDFVFTDAHGEQQNWNHNLTYNSATGLNNPYSDVSLRRYENWGLTSRAFSAGTSDYKALETAWNKRFSDNWQASLTYTRAAFDDCQGDPVFGAFVIAPDLGGECSVGQGDQDHRLVFNGIWQAPGDLQVSGLYFYGSGDRKSLSYGADLRDSGNKSSRLLPDVTGTIACASPATAFTCSLVARNDFVGDAIHRLDMRVMRPIPIGAGMQIDVSFEVFNLLNHANFLAYTTALASPSFGNPRQTLLTAYVPRTAAVGFALKF